MTLRWCNFIIFFFISDCCQIHRTNYWRWSEIPQGPPPERHSPSLGSGRPGKGWERPASPVTSCFPPHVCPSFPTEEEPRCWELGQQWCWNSLIYLNPPAEHHFEIIWTGWVLYSYFSLKQKCFIKKQKIGIFNTKVKQNTILWFQCPHWSGHMAFCSIIISPSLVSNFTQSLLSLFMWLIPQSSHNSSECTHYTSQIKHKIYCIILFYLFYLFHFV